MTHTKKKREGKHTSNTKNAIDNPRRMPLIQKNGKIIDQRRDKIQQNKW